MMNDKNEENDDQCILGKCVSPELCNNFSACDAKLVKEEYEEFLREKYTDK